MRSISSWLRRFVVNHFAPVVSGLLLLSTLLVVIQLHRFNRNVARNAAAHAAQTYTAATREMQSLCHSRECPPAKSAYAASRSRIYSNFAFPWRNLTGGPRDEFERLALERLRIEPSRAFASFENLEGKPVLRFATAHQMQEACVHCHNTHPYSPKRDWKIGDVGGVLAVTTPVIAESKASSSGIGSTLALLGVIMTAVVSLFGFMFRRLGTDTAQLREFSQELGEQTKALRLAQSESEIANNELKKNAVALERSRVAALNLMRDMREAKDKAEAAAETKSRFLANMSHEIRTPMTAILGYAEKLNDTLSDDDALESVATIRRSGQHLLNVINNVLDLSKIESGTFHLDQHDCQPLEMLCELRDLMRYRAERKGITWKVFADSPLPKLIKTDATKLRQILINLIGNAFKFTDTGSVELRASVRYNFENRRQEVVFEVIDTGIGLHQEEIDVILEPFVQADSSMSRVYDGTGLGLSISHHFAQLLGGSVEIESEKDIGSTFRVTIAPDWPADVRWSDKLDDATDDLVNTIERDEFPLQSLRILAADDSMDNRRLLKFVLERAGATLTLAENGLECRTLALKAHRVGAPYDVILLDMQMPVMDGYTTVRDLRKQGYAHSIVALTAHALADDRDKCVAAGCDEFATKPYQRQQLIKLIFDVVANARLAKI